MNEHDPADEFELTEEAREVLRQLQARMRELRLPPQPIRSLTKDELDDLRDRQEQMVENDAEARRLANRLAVLLFDPAPGDRHLN